MPQFVLLGLFAFVALLTGCSRPEAPPELRWRFLGGLVLKSQTNAPVLREILNLPEGAPLAGPLATNLAAAWWSYGTGGRPMLASEANAGAELATDLLERLSVGEAVAAPEGGREFAIAIQVPAERVKIWEQAWPAWINALHATRGGPKTGPPTVVRRDVWLLAVSDSSRLPDEPTLRRLAAYPPVTGSFLQFDAAIPQFPTVQAAFVPTNGSVRLTATVNSLKSLPSAFPAWELPPAIREPLIQFTALRGLEAIGQGWFDIASWTGGQWPREVYVWGQDGFALRSYLAARTQEPTSIIQYWFKRWEPEFAPVSPLPLYRGRLLQVTNPPGLVLDGGLPATPVMQAKQDGDHQFLTLGVVPIAAATNPPAAEMLARMNRPNLVLYDWEFTSESIKHWHALAQVPELFEGRQAIMSAPGTRWLLAAAKKLGETVTEATVTGEREISVVRKAPGGLSGLELTALVKWLDPDPPMHRRLTNNPAVPSRK